MGLLDSVIGAMAGGNRGQAGGLGGMLGGGGGGVQGALITAVIGMLANGAMGGGANAANAANAGNAAGAPAGGLGGMGGMGGLGDLIGKFSRGGMGDVMSSWVGTGQNQPISGGQLTNVLGNDTISDLARQLGLSNEETAGQLSQVLPEVVDKLTPNGQAPAGGLGSITDILAQLTRR